MRWNCPHCGTPLVANEAKIGPGWTFSRCYQCGGFSLVRQPELNLVKVDSTPKNGVLLSDNTGLQQAPPKYSLKNIPQSETTLATVLSPAMRNFPKKTYEVKGQTLLPSTTPTVPQLSAAQAQKIFNYLPVEAIAEPIAPPLPHDVASTPQWKQSFFPFAIGVVGSIALGSGFYLFIQAQSIFKETDYLQKESAETAALLDQIQRSAMAPVAPPVAPPVEKSVARELSQEETIKKNQTTDHVDLNVVLKVSPAKLRAGPSTQFAIVTEADPQTVYTVIAWEKDWFKVKPQTVDAKTSGKDLWIRNDLVQLAREKKP